MQSNKLKKKTPEPQRTDVFSLDYSIQLKSMNKKIVI